MRALFCTSMAAAIVGGMALAAAGAARAQTEKVVYAFKGDSDGENPMAGLIDVGGLLYGTTDTTVFKVTPAGVEKVVNSFDGDAPVAGLIDVGGTLFGTTEAGGSGCRGGCGTVFGVTAAGVQKVLYSFGNWSNGAYPDAGLINVGGMLYGTTSEGGTKGCLGYGCGTVFKMTMAGVVTQLYRFKGGKDGANPEAGLIDVGGTLYGTTERGDTGCGVGCGTVFKVTPAGIEKVIYSFKGGSDGALPVAGLIDLGGTLYGTTQQGGSGTGCGGVGCGTVFKVTPAGIEKVIYSFQGGSDGANPDAGLINVGGTLYGTTYYGGSTGCEGHFGCGTVFKVTTAGVEKVVYSFKGGSDGASPQANLIDVGGTLYGTTYYGGYYGGGANCVDVGCGTVFKVTP